MIQIGLKKKNTGKTSNGCLVNIFRILAFLVLISFGILYLLEGQSEITKSGFIVGSALLLIGFFIKFKKGISVFLGVIVLLGVFSYLFTVFGHRIDDPEFGFEWDNIVDILDDSEEDEMWVVDDIENDSAEENYDLDDFYSQEHSWHDNNQNRYSGNFEIKKEDFNSSRESRDRHRVFEDSDHDYWENVYRFLHKIDKGKMNGVLDVYNEIGKKKKLNKKDFADMIVTSVQDIPYVLVHELSHQEADDVWGGYIAEYHEGGGDCLDEIRFSLQSPVEFISNFKGDCDTRSLYCYLILTYFEYDVTVLVSDKYSHAILGIEGNYRGKFVKYREKKYYGWETTTTGYSPGMMSSDCQNMNFWYVSLASKNN